MNLKALMLLKAAGGEPIPLDEITVTGNPVVFSTDVKKALKGLSIPFAPTQTGSGDPSPSNVRPIYGLTSLNIYHSGEDTHSPNVIPVSWQAGQGEVFGGTLDAVTGLLTIDCGSMIFTGAETEDWKVESNDNFYIKTSSDFVRQTTTSTMICNVALSDSNLYEGKCKITSTGNFNIKIGATIGVFTVADFRTWLSTHNVHVVCMLATPRTVQLSPVSIKTLVGENNLWTDTSGTNTVKYLKKETT